MNPLIPETLRQWKAGTISDGICLSILETLILPKQLESPSVDFVSWRKEAKEMVSTPPSIGQRAYELRAQGLQWKQVAVILDTNHNNAANCAKYYSRSKGKPKLSRVSRQNGIGIPNPYWPIK